MDIASIGVKEVTGLRDRLVGKGSSATTNPAVKIIGSLFARVYRDGLVETNPVSRVKGVSKKGGGVERRAFSIPSASSIPTEA